MEQNSKISHDVQINNSFYLLKITITSGGFCFKKLLKLRLLLLHWWMKSKLQIADRLSTLKLKYTFVCITTYKSKSLYCRIVWPPISRISKWIERKIQISGHKYQIFHSPDLKVKFTQFTDFLRLQLFMLLQAFLLS